MLVRMKARFSGSRNGELWPPIGGLINVPDQEARDLVFAKYAEYADDPSAANGGEASLDDDDDAGGLVPAGRPEHHKGRRR